MISALLGLLPSAAGVRSSDPAPFAQVEGLGGPFDQMLRHALTAANTQEAQANLSIQQFALGKTDNVHDVLLAVTKADLAFRMFLEIRNRLTEALQEILRMQV